MAERSRSKIKIKGSKETIDLYDKSIMCFGETAYLGPHITIAELPPKFIKTIAIMMAKARQEGFNAAKAKIGNKYLEFIQLLDFDNQTEEGDHHD